MKRYLFLISFLSLFISVSPAFAQNKCDRKHLVGLMDQYLAALAQHDPGSVPLANDVQLVENAEKTAIGRGLWQTASSGATEFKIIAADSAACQVGFIGIMHEKDKPILLSVRLKEEEGKIAEIDHMIVRNLRQPLSANLKAPQPGFLTPLKPSERIPREHMLGIAYTYYESIVNNNGKLCPFADECTRRENGSYSVNVPEEAGGGDSSVFRRMKCGEQMDTGIWSYITHIDQRRLIAADEEIGLVFAFSMFVHDGTPKVLKIKGVPGITEAPNDYGAFNLPATHIFKIRNGKIYDIEAIGYMAEYGIRNGWE
jgi:hypothetical protein